MSIVKFDKKNGSNKLSQKLAATMCVAVILAGAFTTTKLKALPAGPALEIYSYCNWEAVRIGPNNDNIRSNHYLSFGKILDPCKPGLFTISIWDKELDFVGHRDNNQNLPATYMVFRANGDVVMPESFCKVGIGVWNPDPQYKLDVYGKIRTEDVYKYSDKRYKTDITPINNWNNLLKVNSVQYKSSSEALHEQLQRFKEENQGMEAERFNSMVSGFEQNIAQKDADTTTHFGFIAQELREIYPNIVCEDAQGYLSVNYTELIPVLVEAIKELNSKINGLTSNGFVKPSVSEIVSSAKLEQNNPNPFTDNTEIKFYIPADSRSASICVYDMVGKQLIKLDILDRGYSSLTIHGKQLVAGMYLYSLLVDGKEIDTKRMILTDK